MQDGCSPCTCWTGAETQHGGLTAFNGAADCLHTWMLQHRSWFWPVPTDRQQKFYDAGKLLQHTGRKCSVCCALLCGTGCAGGFQTAWVMQQDDSCTRWMRQRSVISSIHPYFPSIPPREAGEPGEGEEVEKWIGIPGGCCWMISCWNNSRFIQWKIESITFFWVFKGGRKRTNKWCWSDQKTSAEIFSKLWQANVS